VSTDTLSAHTARVELARDLLAQLDRQGRQTERRFAALVQRRRTMSPGELRVRRELLRAEAMRIIGELKGLRAAASMTAGILHSRTREQEIADQTGRVPSAGARAGVVA
jgi:hypothetical protein